MVNITIRAARNAGKLILRYYDRIDTLTITEKQHNDYVTEVDLMAEQEIISTLKKTYPDHAFLGEESGAHGSSDSVWVIDPLDGTTNFLHGFPQFSVSIAFRHNGRLEHGVVYDPLAQEMFTASRGSGAQLNERRIRVSNRKHLDGALLGTGFPFRKHKLLKPYLGILHDVLLNTAGARRAGSAALDLAYVAAGRLDGFWEMGLNEWDMAAGALIIQEAGGLVSDFAGGDQFLEHGDIACGTPSIHSALLKIILQANIYEQGQ